MKLGYTIVYVPDVSESLGFFERAFGFKPRFVHESGTYGELDTGETTLAFASHSLGQANLPQGYVRADRSVTPLGMEIGLVTLKIEERMPVPWTVVLLRLAHPAKSPGDKLCRTYVHPMEHL